MICNVCNLQHLICNIVGVIVGVIVEVIVKDYCFPCSYSFDSILR